MRRRAEHDGAGWVGPVHGLLLIPRSMPALEPRANDAFARKGALPSECHLVSRSASTSERRQLGEPPSKLGSSYHTTPILRRGVMRGLRLCSALPLPSAAETVISLASLRPLSVASCQRIHTAPPASSHMPPVVVPLSGSASLSLRNQNITLCIRNCRAVS